MEGVAYRVFLVKIGRRALDVVEDDGGVFLGRRLQLSKFPLQFAEAFPLFPFAAAVLVFPFLLDFSQSQTSPVFFAFPIENLQNLDHSQAAQIADDPLAAK